MANAKRQHIWVATMHSEHFGWIAAGNTAREALTALSKKWDEHILAGGMTHDERMYEGGPRTWGEFVIENDGQTPAEYYGASIRKLQLGKGYVDHDAEDAVAPEDVV